MARLRRAGLLVVLCMGMVSGCGLVLGIDEGRLVSAGGVDGDVPDTSTDDVSVTNPRGDGDADGGDAGVSPDADCPRNAPLSFVGTADTFIYPTQDAGNPFGGTQSSNNIGFDGAYGLFRFDLKEFAPKLTAKGTVVTLLLTPYPLQVNQEVGGTAQVYPVDDDWDEGDAAVGATWWYKRFSVKWDQPGAGGADRGPLVSSVDITITRPDGGPPDGGPHAFPIGDLSHVALKLGGSMTSEVSLLVVPDPSTPALRLWIAGHELSPPQATPPTLVVSTCAP